MKSRWIYAKTQPFFGFLLVCLLFTSSLTNASPKHYRFAGFNENQWGAGAFLGDPLSLRAYYFTNWKRAFAFSLGYASSKTAQLSVDYLLYGYQAHDKVVDRDFWNSLVFYGGAGVLTGVGVGGNDPADNFQAGLRVVGGIEYIFAQSPWSMRMEVDPEFFIKAKNSVGFAIGIGATYYWWDGAGGRGSETRLRENKTQAVVDDSEFEDAPKKRKQQTKGLNKPSPVKPASEFDEFN